ncbi:hypothetical protein JYU34_007275, partial [Plutella xylostella]
RQQPRSARDMLRPATPRPVARREPSACSHVKFNFRHARICQRGARDEAKKYARSKLCQFVCEAKLTRSDLRPRPRPADGNTDLLRD